MSENNIKKPEFYKNGKIYRIVCNITGEQYIGSTCKTLKQRLQQHKSSYKGYKDGKGNYITSFKILEKGNFDIVLIEDFPCERKELLNARERFYIESMTCVNKCSPNKFIEMGKVEYHKEYQKQYTIDNRDKIIDYSKKHYNDNKDKRFEQMKQYYDENKDKIIDYQKDYQKEYRMNNREKLNEQQTESIPCIHCGCTYARVNKLRHERSKKHQKNSSSDSDTTISDITI